MSIRSIFVCFLCYNFVIYEAIWTIIIILKKVSFKNIIIVQIGSQSLKRKLVNLCILPILIFTVNYSHLLPFKSPNSRIAEELWSLAYSVWAGPITFEILLYFGSAFKNMHCRYRCKVCHTKIRPGRTRLFYRLDKIGPYSYYLGSNI